jgi:ribokinase
MAFDVVTFGSASRDIIIRPKKLTNLQYKKTEGHEVCFPLGSKIDIDEIYSNSGGGGTNTAATFANQGLKTAFCGVVGNDLEGQEVIHELKGLNVDTKFIIKTKHKPTNHSIVILEGDIDRTILAYRGAAELLSYIQIPLTRLKTKWLYLAPMTGLLCESFKGLIDFARKNHIKLAVNPSIAQLSLPNFPQLAQHIDILIMNEEEASFLTKIPPIQEQEVFAALDVMCPGIAVMTKGADGVVVSDNKTIYSAKPHPGLKIIDTTGAGDAFGSGFVVEFMLSWAQDSSIAIEKAIQFGMANAAACISSVGAKNGLLKKGQPFEKVQVIKK